MPSSKEHRDKADQIRAFLGQLVSTNAEPAWIAVVAFYTAMHLIERLAACENIHNSKHPDRLNYLIKHKKHRAIHADFQTLFDASLVARYGTVNQFQKAFPSAAVATLVNHHLAGIEAYVNAHFAPPVPIAKPSVAVTPIATAPAKP